MWSFNTTHPYNVCKEPRSGTHMEVLNHPRLSARSFLQLCSSKRSSSSLLSIPVCNTRVLDVVWRSDRREIFGTHQNNGFWYFWESRGLQIRTQRFNITRLLPYILYGDFREVNFDVCYLQNYLTKFSRTKFF